jgi:hypothetical protein
MGPVGLKDETFGEPDVHETKDPRSKIRTRREPLELQTRIACRGKSAGAVLEELKRALSDAKARRRDPLIVLEDLGLLQDSVMTFIKGLSRLLVGYPRTVSFWESSGYTEAFLNAMEPPTP